MTLRYPEDMLGIGIDDGRGVQVLNKTKLKAMAAVHAPAAAAKKTSLIRPQFDPALGPGAARTRLETLNFTEGIPFRLTEVRDKLGFGHSSLLHIWGFGRFHDIAVMLLSISKPRSSRKWEKNKKGARARCPSPLPNRLS